VQKQVYFYILCISLLFQSCERREILEYRYEENPQYSWGEVYFWGADYANYGLENNVLSLVAFTDSLSLDSKSVFQGFGQYLFLEDIFISPGDIFISPGDTLFPSGIYKVSDSGDSLTIAPGELFEEDGVKSDLGAYIYFIEKNEHFTTRKFIVDGSMIVSYTENSIYFYFDFILNDDTKLKGRFETNELVVYNESVTLKNTEKKITLNQADPFLVKQFVNKQRYKRKSKYTSQ